MARILAERQGALHREVDDWSRGSAQPRALHLREEILEKIKHFFGIANG